MTNFSKSFVATLIVLVVLLTIVPAALAASVGVKISPLILKYSVEKGHKTSGVVTVINPNSFNIKVKSEVEDFVMGNEQGAPQFFPQGSGVTTLASWIKVSIKELNLKPNEKKEVPFSINVPKDGEPGGHYAAVFFKTKSIKTAAGQTQVTVSGRAGTLVLVSVPGDITQSGQIAEFVSPGFLNKGPVDFKVRFKNTGNVHYQPSGDIKISSLLKSNILTLPVGKHYVLPKSIRELKAKWKTGYQFGIYTAKLNITDGDNKVLTKSVRFVIFPWKESLIVLTIIIIVIALFTVFRKKFQIVKK